MKFAVIYLIFISVLFFGNSCKNHNNDKLEVIALKAYNGKYIGLAGDTLGLKLVASKDKITEWEKFTLIRLPDSKANFRIFDHLYVCSDFAKYNFLVADRLVPSIWETFTVEDLGRNQIAIKASNGKYVSADSSKKFLLVPDRAQIGDWEKFTIEKQRK